MVFVRPMDDKWCSSLPSSVGDWNGGDAWKRFAEIYQQPNHSWFTTSGKNAQNTEGQVYCEGSKWEQLTCNLGADVLLLCRPVCRITCIISTIAVVSWDQLLKASARNSCWCSCTVSLRAAAVTHYTCSCQNTLHLTTTSVQVHVLYPNLSNAEWTLILNLWRFASVSVHDVALQHLSFLYFLWLIVLKIRNVSKICWVFFVFFLTEIRDK